MKELVKILISMYKKKKPYKQTCKIYVFTSIINIYKIVMNKKRVVLLKIQLRNFLFNKSKTGFAI